MSNGVLFYCEADCDWVIASGAGPATLGALLSLELRQFGHKLKFASSDSEMSPELASAEFVIFLVSAEYFKDPPELIIEDFFILKAESGKMHALILVIGEVNWTTRGTEWYKVRDFYPESKKPLDRTDIRKHVVHIARLVNSFPPTSDKPPTAGQDKPGTMSEETLKKPGIVGCKAKVLPIILTVAAIIGILVLSWWIRSISTTDDLEGPELTPSGVEPTKQELVKRDPKTAEPKASELIETIYGGSAPRESEFLGVIEVGLDGLRAIIMETKIGIDGDVQSVVTEPTTGSVREFLNGVAGNTIEKTLAELQSNHGIGPQSIKIMGRSNLGHGPAREALEASAIQHEGVEVEFLTLEREVELLVRGQLGSRDLTRAMLLDVGKRTTRAIIPHTEEQAGQMAAAEFAFGTVTCVDTCGPTVPLVEFVERLGRLQPIIALQLAETGTSCSLLETRPDLYLTGDICWAVASALAPPDEDQGGAPTFVPLDAEEITDWIEKVTANPSSGYDYATNRLRDGRTSVAEGNRRRLESTIGPAQLASGAMLLKALSSSFHFRTRGNIYFIRGGKSALVRTYADSLVSGRASEPAPSVLVVRVSANEPPSLPLTPTPTPLPSPTTVPPLPPTPVRSPSPSPTPIDLKIVTETERP